jgi:hypothetical protein
MMRRAEASARTLKPMIVAFDRRRRIRVGFGDAAHAGNQHVDP